MTIIEKAWRERPLLWLSGVRRAGKTCLCQSRLERRQSFQRFLELLMAQRGGIFEATRFARPCEVSRTTIANYLAVLEATLVAHVIRPFSTGRATEIVAAPKVYGFDTGFVCYHRGWSSLRREDLDPLWEHFVLKEMQAALQGEPVHHWRDKAGHEVDFVVARRGRPPLAVEGKWSPEEFAARNLRAFRGRYPEGENVVVSAAVDRPYARRLGELRVVFDTLPGLIRRLARRPQPAAQPGGEQDEPLIASAPSCPRLADQWSGIPAGKPVRLRGDLKTNGGLTDVGRWAGRPTGHPFRGTARGVGTDTFIARQPIFDRQQRLWAYELLFRSSPENACTAPDPDQASARIVADSLFVWDRHDLLRGRPAFLNATRRLLLQDHAALCPPGQTVVEILECVEPDGEVMASCRQLRQAGYRLALDDFRDDDPRTSLVAVADFLKVDFLETPLAERLALSRRFAPSGIRLVAERVETQEAFDEALGQGYSYFQGYFFARPRVLRAKAAPECNVTHLRLLQEILRPELSWPRLETIVRSDVSLSYKLLRYINSPYLGLRRKIVSLREALAYLGEREVRRWGSLIALAGMGRDRPDELVVEAAVRGRFCELLAPAARLARQAENLFMVGLLSVLDALLERPLEALVGDLPVGDGVKAALLEGRGDLAEVYACGLAYMRGDWARLSEQAGRLGLDEAEASRCYRDALRWARLALSGGSAAPAQSAPGHGAPGAPPPRHHAS